MSSNLEFKATPIAGLFIIERKVITDERGYFFRLFCKDELSEIGLNKSLAQINYSHANKKFTVRGFHFQDLPDCVFLMLLIFLLMLCFQKINFHILNFFYVWAVINFFGMDKKFYLKLLKFPASE